MKNILFATVRQGNCGDEFILFGTQNIISTLQTAYNPIILNKNVEVCRRLQLKNKTLDIEVPGRANKISLNLGDVCFKDEPLTDNSFAEYYSLDFIDAVIFAGTPEWLVYKLLPLYEKLVNFHGPILFLGPGYHEGFGKGSFSDLHPVYRNILKKADLFIVRDRLLLEYLKGEIDAELLPCPALLCSKNHRIRSDIKKIGFSLQAKAGDARVNNIPPAVYYFTLALLKALSRYYEVEIICHWIEDLIYLKKELGNHYVMRYSYDAKDYLGIYDAYDVIISTRVHGSGMAASLGIPTFTVSHSMRTDTVLGFLSRVIELNSPIEKIVEEIKSLDVKEESKKIIFHKNATLEAYQNRLQPFFPLP